MRGINSIELYWDGQRWWIANAIWTTGRHTITFGGSQTLVINSTVSQLTN